MSERESRTKTTKTKKKHTPHCTGPAPMSKEELKVIREKMGRDMTEFADELGMALRTYQDKEYGKSKIEGVMAIAVRSLLKCDGCKMNHAVSNVTELFDMRQRGAVNRKLRGDLHG